MQAGSVQDMAALRSRGLPAPLRPPTEFLLGQFDPACLHLPGCCPRHPSLAAPLAPRRQQAERWRRQRSFIVLVAEDCSSGEVLGCAAVSLAQVGRQCPRPCRP